MAVNTDSVSVSSQTQSEWLSLKVNAPFILDIEVASGATVTVKIKYRRFGGTIEGTVKQPNDITADLELDSTASVRVPGGREYSIDVTSYSGTGDVTLIATQEEYPSAH